MPGVVPVSRRTPIVVAAVLAVATHVIGALLVRVAVPYLGPLATVTPAVVGSAFAVGSTVVVLGSRQGRLAWALVAVAFATAAEPLSLGLAQRSSMWVAVGALAAWVVPAAFLPTRLSLRGEEAGRPGRVASWFASLIASLVTAAVVLTFNPAAWGWCHCVLNPLAVTDTESAFTAIEPWLFGAQFAGTLGTVIALVIELVRRPGRVWTGAGVAAGYGIAASAWAASDAIRMVPLQSAPNWLSYVVAAGLLAMLVGAVSEATRRRPSRAHVADLLLAARERRDPATLDELVARSLGDPGARVLWWDAADATYRDHTGAEAPVTIGAHMLEVTAGGAPLAVVVGSSSLPVDQSLLDSVSEALRLATENQRLAADLEQSLAAVRESRARILTTADETRRRIERDLHDGAQRLLVSTGVQLNLAEAQAADNPELAGTLAKASVDLGEALVELRRLARGITPAALVHSRLRDAIEELTLGSAVPASLVVEGDREPAEAARTAIYFVVAECLTNAAKHAGATAVRVELTLAEPVRISVRDNGRGGADVAGGTGLRGLTDRLSALGGTLEVTSNGSGTTVIACIPGGAA